MNEKFILDMAKPYIKHGTVTYEEFDDIYCMLSKKEQYAVVDILYKNGIELVDYNDDNEVYFIEHDETHNENLNERLIDSKRAINNYLFIKKDIKQSNEVLCGLIQNGNKQAEQDICIKNRRLVDKYVLAYQKRYGNRLDFEDLEQAGLIGLIKAAKRFDFTKDNNFTTYAVFWIKQAISREIMDHGTAIRIPVHMMDKINKVMISYNKFIGKGYGLSKKIELISNDISLSEETVRECLLLKKNYLTYTSLDISISENDETAIGEFIPIEDEKFVESIIIDNELKTELQEVLESLSNREKDIIIMRFGLDDGSIKTLEKIGEIFGVTRERIRQIEAKALRKLRHPSRKSRLKVYMEDL